MSTRLWTAGYDIFSPSRSVVGHIYVRRHKPKFWESVHRAFTPGIHNPLQVCVAQSIVACNWSIGICLSPILLNVQIDDGLESNQVPTWIP